MSATYPEPTVSRVMGPKRMVLITTRRLALKKEQHWLMVDGVVNYTEDGLALMCSKLGVELVPLKEAIAKNLAERAAPPPLERDGEASAAAPGAATAPAPTPEKSAPPADLVDVLVTGRSPNPLIVFGQVDGAPVRVKVRSNDNFTAGLVIKAKFSEAAAIYLMVGNPPRWRGDKVGFTRQPNPPATTPNA